jgi:hypothetical protein
MADTVNVQEMFDGKRRYVVRLYNVSDGTGETNVLKVDKSTLVNLAGVEPSKLALGSVQWSIQGFTYVAMAWDHTVDSPLIVLAAGNGAQDYMCGAMLQDPLVADGTGDILLSTGGAIAGASYNIVLELYAS